MEDIDSLNYDTQVAIKQLEVEKVEYKLKLYICRCKRCGKIIKNKIIYQDEF